LIFTNLPFVWAEGLFDGNKIYQPHMIRVGPVDRYSSQFKNNYFTEMCCGSEAGSHLRFIDFCITQLQA